MNSNLFYKYIIKSDLVPKASIHNTCLVFKKDDCLFIYHCYIHFLQRHLEISSKKYMGDGNNSFKVALCILSYGVLELVNEHKVLQRS